MNGMRDSWNSHTIHLPCTVYSKQTTSLVITGNRLLIHLNVQSDTYRVRITFSIFFFVCFRLSNIFATRKEDLTQFVVTFQQTELVGKRSLKHGEYTGLSADFFHCLINSVKLQVGNSFR